MTSSVPAPPSAESTNICRKASLLDGGDLGIGDVHEPHLPVLALLYTMLTLLALLALLALLWGLLVLLVLLALLALGAAGDNSGEHEVCVNVTDMQQIATDISYLMRIFH